MKLFLFVIYFSISILSFSQKKDRIPLFKINDSITYYEEFERVYKKNFDIIASENNEPMDYLDLFVNFKLKVSEAYAIGLHEDPEYKKELRKYISQLQSSFLIDKETQERLLIEAYSRLKEEVNVDHVLFRLSEESSDTTQVLEELNKLRKPFSEMSFNDFLKLAKEVNGDLIIEELGYFSVFRMIYEFENFAYNTKVGEVSKPFRTKFGYHILKVNEKRKSLGEITVAHIMKYKNKTDSYEIISSILDSLNNGSSFEKLAKKFSDDKNSSFRGGVLNKFTSGQINSIDFENAAFGLKSSGDISNVVETKYGWHIIKLIKKESIPEFSLIRGQLLNKLKKSSRYKVISDSFYNFLLEKYNLSFENPLTNLITKNYDIFFNGENWLLPDNFEEEAELFRIRNKKYSLIDFATFLEDNQPEIKNSIKELINSEYKRFLKSELISFYKNNLISENSDYSNLVKEYKEGLLLFNIMQKNIWNKSSYDEQKVQDFYEKNKSNYISFDKNKSEILNDFQNYNESQWIKQLKIKYEVNFYKKGIKKIKKLKK